MSTEFPGIKLRKSENYHDQTEHILQDKIFSSEHPRMQKTSAFPHLLPANIVAS